MSCYHITYKDGAKIMTAVNSRAEFEALRSTSVQKALVKQAREGSAEAKRRLVQFNYSCMPNQDGTLKGASTPSNTVGMDIDHLTPDELKTVQDVCLNTADALGIVLVERSARGEGLHVVFKRDPSKTQEENLKAMSAQLCVPYDEGAKDITRVFFATTEEPTELLYLNDELFVNEGVEGVALRRSAPTTQAQTSEEGKLSRSSSPNCDQTKNDPSDDSRSSSPNCGPNTTDINAEGAARKSAPTAEGGALRRSAPTSKPDTYAVLLAHAKPFLRSPIVLLPLGFSPIP